MVRVTGLWLRKDKKGATYLQGNMGFATVLLLKNEFKTSDSQPDYNMYLVASDKPTTTDIEETQL